MCFHFQPWVTGNVDGSYGVLSNRLQWNLYGDKPPPHIHDNVCVEYTVFNETPTIYIDFKVAFIATDERTSIYNTKEHTHGHDTVVQLETVLMWRVLVENHWRKIQDMTLTA